MEITFVDGGDDSGGVSIQYVFSILLRYGLKSYISSHIAVKFQSLYRVIHQSAHFEFRLKSAKAGSFCFKLARSLTLMFKHRLKISDSTSVADDQAQQY